MAINKKLIHFEKRENFDTRLANNEINDTSIVFIQDTGELWTHGLFFCTTATNLLEAPSLLTVGDTIAVQIGDKTSNYIVPPAALKGRTMYECITNTTDTRGHWTGTVPGVTELYDGLVIHVRFTTTYYGNGEGYNTLNINNLGPKLIWYRYGSILTTHWGSNAELTLTYRTTAGSYKVGNAKGELTNGTTYTDGWVADYAYYSDSTGYYHKRIYPNLKAGPNKIFPYTMIMQLPDGRWESIVTSSSAGTSKTRNTHGFLLGHVLLMYANATYNENGNVGTYNIFSAHSGLIDHRYSFNTASNATYGTTGYKPVYIVGTIGNDGLFYLAETWWTQTLPDEEDGKVYIYVGDAYDTYRLTFTEDKPIYVYRNGGIRLYSGTSDNVSWSNITNKPESFTPASHNHDSLYVTSVDVTDDTTNHANQLRYVKNGVSTYFTVPFATNADTVDGYHETSFFRSRGAINVDYVDLTTYTANAEGYLNPQNGIWTVSRSGYTESLITFTGKGSTSGLDIYFNYAKGSAFQFRRRIDSNRVSGDWEKFITDLNYTSYTVKKDGTGASGTWGISISGTATTANNLNKATLGYLYQSATTTTSATGTVTATSGKIGVPIQFYGSKVNYALNNDLFYATVASNAITANTIYLGDAIKSKTFVKTSAHVPTGASSESSSSSGNPGESITYTAGDGIKIAGTLISTNTWTGTESLFAELANPSSYDLIYIIED